MNFNEYDATVKHHINLYLEEVVRPSFPFISYFGGSSWGGSLGAYVEMPMHNFSLKGSEYYFDETDRFIHYTSLRNAINILNEEFLRVFDFNYFDDPQELFYAGKELLGNYTWEEIKALRERIFAISMCEFDEKENPDTFDLWRLYGENGYGAALVFKFFSDASMWREHFLSRVYYGDEEKVENFKTFVKNHNHFLDKYRFQIQGNSFGKAGKIPEWIAIFLGFHKNSLYKIENEIRFLFWDDQFKSRNSISFAINSKFERSRYYKIPLLTKKNLFALAKKNNIEIPYYKNTFWESSDAQLIEQIIKYTPIIKIEKIILGYRYSEEQVEKIKKAIKDEFILQAGFDIEIVQTHLTKEFK